MARAKCVVFSILNFTFQHSNLFNFNIILGYSKKII